MGAAISSKFGLVQLIVTCNDPFTHILGSILLRKYPTKKSRDNVIDSILITG